MPGDFIYYKDVIEKHTVWIYVGLTYDNIAVFSAM